MDRYIVEAVNTWQMGVAVSSAVVINETRRYIVFEIDGNKVPLPKDTFPIYTFVSFDMTIKLTFKKL